MNYKRKGHRGRHKQNVMDNQGSRVCGNSAGKERWGYRNGAHLSASQRRADAWVGEE